MGRTSLSSSRQVYAQRNVSKKRQVCASLIHSRQHTSSSLFRHARKVYLIYWRNGSFDTKVKLSNSLKFWQRKNNQQAYSTSAKMKMTEESKEEINQAFSPFSSSTISLFAGRRSFSPFPECVCVCFCPLQSRSTAPKLDHPSDRTRGASEDIKILPFFPNFFLSFLFFPPRHYVSVYGRL